MMVRFSCFPTHVHYHKTKKAISQSSGEAFSEETQKSDLEFSQDMLRVTPGFTSSILNEEISPSNSTTAQISSPGGLEYCWKLEDLNSNPYYDDNKVVFQATCLKKSQSLGSGLDRERELSYRPEMEDETDQGTCIHDKDCGRCYGCVKSYGWAELCDNDGSKMDLLSSNHETVGVESFHVNSEQLQHEPISSIGDGKHTDEVLHEVRRFLQSDEHFVDLGHIISENSAAILKSQSLPSLTVSTDIHTEGSPDHEYMGPQSETCEDLPVADAKAKLSGHSYSDGLVHQPSVTLYCGDVSQTPGLDENRLIRHVDSVGTLPNLSSGTNKMVDQKRDSFTEGEEHKCDHPLSDGYNSCTLSVSGNDCRECKTDCLSTGNSHERESLVKKWDDKFSKEFNVKRIEDWVHQTSIQDSFVVQELGESSNAVPKLKQESNVMSHMTTPKPDNRGSPGIVEAYNYISSLAAASTTAQMVNLGLVVIPSLGAFITLRMLNLSGNALVRINAGALPRGLHMLNLSKNSISTIEGLRELSRLRILDLSYNRVLRIGHGLASCSSLKELYLAGNKISEVEGLHRLLKLNILDLRHNKISTAKCLGQLAANYASLQSINLEGNPAQRNVRDEQLKRYLLSLLPRLVYYNRHTIRANSSKEVSDRSVRTSCAHQFDHALRSEHKHSRRGKLASAPHKSATSSNHGRSSQKVSTSANLSKSRHGHLPSTGSNGNHQLPDIIKRLQSMQSSNSMRRSRSEGNF